MYNNNIISRILIFLPRRYYARYIASCRVTARRDATRRTGTSNLRDSAVGKLQSVKNI